MREFFTIAIFKIKADIRMNKTTLNSQKEKHSMLSLRRVTVVKSATRKRQAFLSTLSLRRTTRYFRPHRECASISIHALLAESDRRPGRYLLLSQISIHALLAERDCYTAMTL